MKHFKSISPNMQEPVRTVGPSSPLIYIGEAKEHSRISSDDDEGYLAGLVAAATQKLDGYNGDVGKALITQTWRVDFDKFPRQRRFDLPLGPIQSATIAYSDLDNATQTLASSKYAVMEDASGPYLYLDEGEDAWPGTYEREDAVRVTTVVGYGDNPSDVPQDIRLAALHLAALWYERREPVSTANNSPLVLPYFIDYLLTNHRRLWF